MVIMSWISQMVTSIYHETRLSSWISSIPVLLTLNACRPNFSSNHAETYRSEIVAIGSVSRAPRNQEARTTYRLNVELIFIHLLFLLNEELLLLLDLGLSFERTLSLNLGLLALGSLDSAFLVTLIDSALLALFTGSWGRDLLWGLCWGLLGGLGSGVGITSLLGLDDLLLWG
ncbi:hypothetical protein B0J14DRAFT_266949 [Halenospora varia]|nr:hypothetical protein B0J14DRAFT_266949 [Halenospora varia]